MLRDLRQFRTGTKPSELAIYGASGKPLNQPPRINPTHGRGSLYNSKTLREGDDDNIPADCPSQADLRTVGNWLLDQYPLAGLVDLVHARDYQAGHELVGAHDAIQAIFQLADDLDAAQRDADAQAAEAGLP